MAERCWTELKRAAVLVLVVFFAVAEAGATPAELVERVVREEMEAAGTPAMAALVLRDGKVVAAFATGMADPAAEQEAGLDTVFPAGSITKLLTAALVMKQVEDGRLDLDVPVNSYLAPDEQIIDKDGRQVPATLRQILSHTSGLPVAWDGIPPSPPVTSSMAYLSANRVAIHPPGERIVYSNSAMALAGLVAARAAGLGFADYARTALFEPLGMTRSSFGAPGDIEGLAAGHVRRSGGIEPVPNPDLTPLAPAGALLTTVHDLGRFARMILEGGTVDGVQILTPASVSEMLRLSARIHPDLNEGFGLGFGLREVPGRNLAWWDGSTGAAAAHFALMPDNGLVVIVLSNLADNHATSVAGRRIRDALIPPSVHAAYNAAPDVLAERAGNYRTLDFVDPRYAFVAWFMPFRVAVDGAGGLEIRSAMLGEMQLVPVAPNRFMVRGSMLDGSTALFDGDILQVGFVRTLRQPALLSPAALIVYAGLVAALLLALAGWGLWRLVRRRRAR
jgi:CubicO group peptidase (beta-lactamase class C family)